MRKRRIIILAVSFVAVLAGVIWWTVATRPAGPPDPVYDGHPLSYWVDFAARHEVGMDRLPTLDSDALPYLVQKSKARDGALRKAYTYVWPHLPAGLRTRLPAPMDTEAVRCISCSFLGSLKAGARPAIPDLVYILRVDPDWGLRAHAADALGMIANRDDTPVVEALIAAAKGPDPFCGRIATRALTAIAPEAAAKAGVTNPAVAIHRAVGGR